MSTRSGKRIHNSFQEGATGEVETVVNSERKTRGRRNKDVTDAVPLIKKKRNNYVSYPTDDENNEILTKPDDAKLTRVLRKNALKEVNTEPTEVNKDVKSRTRKSRRGKKLSDTNLEDEDHENVPSEVIPKSKKKKKTSVEPPEDIKQDSEPKKSKKKKKKGKKSDSTAEVENGGNNVNNMSVDSFHSAAGSPELKITEKPPEKRSKTKTTKPHTTTLPEDQNNDKSDEKDVSNIKNVTIDIKDVSDIKNTTFDKEDTSIKNSTPDKKDASYVKNTTFDKVEDIQEITVNRSRRSNVSISNGDVQSNACNTTFDKNEPSIQQTNTSNTKSKSKKKIMSTPVIEKDDKNNFDKTKSLSPRKSIKNTTFDKLDVVNTTNINTTYEKDKKDSTFDKSVNNTTFEKVTNNSNETCDKTDSMYDKDTSSTFDKFKKGALQRKSSIIDAYEKSNISMGNLTKEDFDKDKNISSSSLRHSRRLTTEINNSPAVNNTTFENSNTVKATRNSQRSSINDKLNHTFDKGEPKSKENSKSSLISSDNSNITEKSEDMSRISITSDDTTENIINTTPVLIESSMDASQGDISKITSPIAVQTPLKREGTFTKESPTHMEPLIKTPEETEMSKTPTKRKSLPAAGCTPYNINKGSQKKSMMNVTRSIEKDRRSEAPRMTRVMFCSPVDIPVLATTEKRKIIKSNLKGSNKSFVFDDSVTVPRTGRKRSYTQSDADEGRTKRTRLTEDLQVSVNRLSRPRTASAQPKLTGTPAKKPLTPSKPKSEKVRTKLPNFAALHQRRFDKMESLDECQERKAKRAKQLLTPTGSTNVARISPTNNAEPQNPKDPPKTKDKTDTPTKKPHTTAAGFTRFGFKLNLDVNPFSIPSTTDKAKKPNGVTKKIISKPEVPLPSLVGATSVRREVAKQAVMREKSFPDRRNVNRTIIKGVRTNRRFELQMKLRQLE